MALSFAEVSLQMESAFEVKLDPPPHPARISAAAARAAPALRLELAVIERKHGPLGISHDRDLRHPDVDRPGVFGAPELPQLRSGGLQVGGREVHEPVRGGPGSFALRMPPLACPSFWMTKYGSGLCSK